MQRVPKESYYSPKIEIRESATHGKGTFAKAPIKKGEVVEIWGEYTNGGEYTDDKEKVEVARKQGKAVGHWDTDLYSIEDKGGDDGYFINHCCDSNLWFVDAFTLTARKDIKLGEEVTIDYALFESEDDYVAIKNCSCSATNCRHVITGKDWRMKKVQKMYKHHFVPLINKMIDGSL